jgi:hypothetical protein
MSRISELLERMNWDDEDDKKKKKIDRKFVSCDQRNTTEANAFDRYEEKYGVDIVNQCCDEVKAPRSRKDFEKCLEEKLKKKKLSQSSKLLEKYLSD